MSKILTFGNGDRITGPVVDSNDTIIIQPKVTLVSVKRLTTKDGNGQALANVRVGDTYRIDMSSVAYVEITKPNGVKFKCETVHVVDEFGRDMGWMYAELFFV